MITSRERCHTSSTSDHLLGFLSSWLGLSSTTNFSQTLQFYYCFGYLVIGVMSIVGLNLYLWLAKRKLLASAVIGMVATTPAILVSVFFASAYVNGIPLGLPIIPVLPMSAVYVLFAVTGIIIMFATITAVPNLRGKIWLAHAVAACRQAEVYRVIPRLKTGTAIAVIIAPETIRKICALSQCLVCQLQNHDLSQRTNSQINGSAFDMSCIRHGIYCIGKNEPLSNIIGNI